MVYNPIFLLMLLVCNLHSNLAFADVYEYVDGEGVSHYSDSQIDGHYLLIMSTPSMNAKKGDVNAEEDKDSVNNISLGSLENLPPGLLEQVQVAAKNNQLDSELVHAVMGVESHFNQQAKSHKGALGLMQLMPATAERFGVKNPFDTAQNIEGGAKYLRLLLNLFNNDLRLAVAAYNAGENAVIRHGYVIPPYKETQAYVPKVIALYKALLKKRTQVIP